MKIATGVLSVLGMIAFSAAASAAPFINGDFETGVAPPAGGFSTLSAGSTDITGWLVAGGTQVNGPGSVDYINGYWDDADPVGGSRSVDLNGNGAGGVYQAFDTVVGQAYSVSFALAGNPDQGSIKDLTAFANDGAGFPYLGGGLFTFDSTGHTKTGAPGMGWLTYSFAFVADSVLTTLNFSSLTDSAFGPALDNVSVSAVPIPAALPLFASGLAAFGVFANRRRRKVSAQA